jgi:hypothetical protein
MIYEIFDLAAKMPLARTMVCKEKINGNLLKPRFVSCSEPGSGREKVSIYLKEFAG